MKNIKFDFDDILLQPAKVSNINSRKEINPLDNNGFLPLFTAPMDTVVSYKNRDSFIKAGINVVLPRGGLSYDDCFSSYGFNEFSEAHWNNQLNPKGKYLIDVANGHMKDVIALTKGVKTKNPHMILMVGNVANPKTYKLLSDAGADYIRVGIGNGAGCLTTQQTAIGYPMGSLIVDCYTISETLDKPAKIVADGGFQKYSDIIKALALGADYVMVGSLLNKTIESSGDNYLFQKIKINEWLAKKLYAHNVTIYKNFRGMSTKEVQKKWGRQVLKTSEGVTRMRKVEYSLDQWTENFEDYLKSAMSYCNARTLNEFIGYAEYNFISENSLRRFKK